jgi:transcriptional regulator with XRE-family HTH domain
MSVKSPNPIDLYVGSKIKLQRNTIGMSQETLAASLGITFQQVQKYERGINRVGASRLQAIARVLGVPIGFFFHDGPDHAPTLAGVDLKPMPDLISEFLSTRESIKLNQSFCRIKDIPTRKRILALVKTLAGMDEAQDVSLLEADGNASPSLAG